ncbi:hypothetical protein [Amycolatopsis sp. NPDC051903]|uniref:hypothetical protein n=1 Tax=Amycolatopsis sp. NPDC051903 TaxID=3363936 RepID=UPI0037ACB827
MTTNDPRELISQLRCIESALSAGVGIRLGQWAGLGDWQALSADGRAHAGVRALAELDSAIQHLAALRGGLARQLGATTSPNGDQREGR